MNSEQTQNSVPISAKIAAIVACILWAASFIATKTALKVVPPLTIVSLRLIISSLCFIIWLMIRREKIEFRGIGWVGQMVLLSLFGSGFHYGIQTIGITMTTASNASLFAATGPISITLIALIFLRERITLKKALGICIALIGVLIVQGIDTLKSFDLRGHLMGDFLVFASIFMWGVFTVLGKKVIRKMNAIHLTAIVTVIGAIYMLPVGIVESRKAGFSLSSVTLEAWGAVAFLGITCSFLATYLYFFALERAESQKVGVFLYTIPPMSYLFAGLFLSESIGLNLIIGSVVVLMGVFLTEKG